MTRPADARPEGHRSFHGERHGHDPGQRLAAAWRDHLDRPTTRPLPPATPFYGPMMAFQGADYDRNAFARGTGAELAALRGRVPLSADSTVLDVGCATGRHLRALAADPGCGGVGVDVAPELVAVADELAGEQAVDRRVRFAVGDARRLHEVPAVAEVVAAGGFDVAWSLCQGGFGTDVDGDHAVLDGMAAALRPGGHLVLSAFHALFAVRHLAPGDAFDPVHGVHHQRTELRGPDHARQEFDLWSTAWTVRELVAAVTSVGLVVAEVAGCQPGRFDADEVRLDDPELLVVARRPPSGGAAVVDGEAEPTGT